MGGIIMNKYDEAVKLLDEKFGNKDVYIALATIGQSASPEGNSCPVVRIVDAFYEDGAFYTVTYATSNKMQEIAKNPQVALCIVIDIFTASGIGENLGWVCDEKNAEIMAKARKIFAEWYYEANNEEDQNTCLLRIKLTKGVWNNAHEGIRSEIDFVNKMA